MNILYIKSKEVEPPEELGKAIQKLIEEKIDLIKWGFQLSFQDFDKFAYQKIIYNSIYCRFYISFSRGRWPMHDKLNIGYGRLHAPDNKAIIYWQKEECHCWHSLYNHIKFLDGMSAKEAFESDKMGEHLPKLVKDFRYSIVGEKLREKYPPEYVIAEEATVWEHYGQGLFDLFDLRQPEFWEEYRAFLREYYQLTREKSQYGPPHENVC